MHALSEIKTQNIGIVYCFGRYESDKYLNNNTFNDAYVKALYRTFMDRECDEVGLEFWNNIFTLFYRMTKHARIMLTKNGGGSNINNTLIHYCDKAVRK